jgi:predicted O-methyltransferase YrrM
MNAVLADIVTSQQVSDGTRSFPLRHPRFPGMPVAVDPDEGAWLQRIVADIQPYRSLEIGCAYGVSSLYICEELARLPARHASAAAAPQAARHIVLDPFQTTEWRGIGIKNIRDAGYASLVDFREERSEVVLPRLLADGATIDFAFVDGWHTFDQVLMEFYFLNRLLRVGGVIAFDDANRRSINRVVRHALTYPAYRAYGTEQGHAAGSTWLGRGRRALAGIPAIGEILRPDFLRKDWDLGILGTCVAIRKVADDERSSGWDRAF